MEHPGELVKVIRKSSSGEWVELQKDIVAIVAQSGVVLRDRASNALVADFPSSAVHTVEKVSEIVLTLNAEGCRVGLKFESASSLSRFCARAEAHQLRITQPVKVHRGEDDQPFTMPRLEDPTVQEFILKLLFSDEFKGFVGNLKDLLCSMEENIDVTK